MNKEQMRVKFEWQPIETAPKNNKHPLLIARFDSDGNLLEFDYGAYWELERESWETPELYYFWASAHDAVEEPTHWCYEPEGFSKLPEKGE